MSICEETWRRVTPVPCEHGYIRHCPQVDVYRARQPESRREGESGSGISLGSRCSICGRYHATPRCPFASKKRP